jgi:5-methyltetrahydrofolate--homocysteine methyltransferase
MPHRFLDKLQSGRILLMDGAMGTELQRAGLPAGVCSEAWNLTNPRQVRVVHQEYVQAGAEVLVANTFQANRHALERAAVADPVADVITDGLRLAFCAAAKHHFVLLSIGPWLAPGSPSPTIEPDVLHAFVPACRCADAILFETWSDPVALGLARTLRAHDPALLSRPMLLSLSFARVQGPERGARGAFLTFDGRHAPEWYASQAEANGFAALGVNCGQNMGVLECAEVLRRFRRETDLPLFARPNAGTPRSTGGTPTWPESPATMAAALPELLETGPAMIGGCCGTTPAHIAAFRNVIDEWNARPR